MNYNLNDNLYSFVLFTFTFIYHLNDNLYSFVLFTLTFTFIYHLNDNLYLFVLFTLTFTFIYYLNDNLYSFVLFTGGFETTANALTFMCFLLAKNQDVQDKLYQEISENIEVISSDLMSRVWISILSN